MGEVETVSVRLLLNGTQLTGVYTKRNTTSTVVLEPDYFKYAPSVRCNRVLIQRISYYRMVRWSCRACS